MYLAKFNSRPFLAMKPKRGEPGFVCECKICLRNKEFRRLSSLLPPADAKIMMSLVEDLDMENFDVSCEIAMAEDRWRTRYNTLEKDWALKYNELSSKIHNVLII